MKKEQTTLGDRLAAALVMFLAAFITGCVIWGVTLYASAKALFMFVLPFSIVLYFSGFFAIFAFLAPNRSLDIMGGIWKKMENLGKNLIH